MFWTIVVLAYIALQLAAGQDEVEKKVEAERQERLRADARGIDDGQPWL